MITQESEGLLVAKALPDLHHGITTLFRSAHSSPNNPTTPLHLQPESSRHDRGLHIPYFSEAVHALHTADCRHPASSRTTQPLLATELTMAILGTALNAVGLIFLTHAYVAIYPSYRGPA